MGPCLSRTCNAGGSSRTVRRLREKRIPSVLAPSVETFTYIVAPFSPQPLLPSMRRQRYVHTVASPSEMLPSWACSLARKPAGDAMRCRQPLSRVY